MNLKNLLSWSEKEFSHLPWRQNRSLYRTLVSEIMLQQTTVSTVKNHYEKFLLRFPTLESLAVATEAELLVAWKGLGYYRRAKNLKKIAEYLVTEHCGEFPNNTEILMKIPGIGPYTANALVGIGMDQRALAIDANLERVIARLLNLKIEKGALLQKEIYNLFKEKKIFNQKVSFRVLNEALMDLGRNFCQARKVTCELCPLRTDCLAFKEGNSIQLPITSLDKKKKVVEHELHLLRVYVKRKDRLLVYKKSSNEWLAGQYEVPTFVLSTTDTKLKQYPKLDGLPVEIQFSFKTGITKYAIKNSVAVLSEKEVLKMSDQFKLEWRKFDSEEANFSTATLKGLAKLNL